MIKASSDTGHTINALAKEQNWPSVKFILDGKTYTANSLWAATDWLKERNLHKEAQHQWVKINGS